MSDYTDARRLDRCDVCGKKVKRDDLKIMTQQYGRSKGSNYFTWSTYNTDLWTCDGTDRGTISDGVRADDSRVKVSLANVSTESGIQTWSGSTTFRVKNGAGIDVSSWTSLCFSCVVGPYQRASSPSLTVEVGIWDIPLGSGTAYKTYSSVLASKECWFTAKIADLTVSDTTNVGFYVIVNDANSQYFWIDELRLEKDVSVPTAWIRTSGAAVSRTVFTKYTGSGKVCEDCIYPLLKTDVAPPDIETSEPVQIDTETTIL